MHIALIHRFYWKDGAIPLIIRGSARWFIKEGIRITVVSSDVNETDSNGEITFYKASISKIRFFDFSGIAFAVSLFFKLLVAHRRQRIDVLIIHDSTGFYGAWLFSKIFKVPNIMYMHACIYDKGKEKVYSKSLAFTYKVNTKFYIKYADIVCCVSRQLCTWAKRLGARRVRLVYNSIDLDKFHPHKKALSNDKKIVLYVGRISPEKGTKYFVQAIPTILEKFPKTKFMIIGGGLQKAELVKIVKDLGVFVQVDFKEQILNEHLPKWYSLADVLVMPSLSESLGIVALESLACGTPVIGSNVGGIPEIINHKYNGLLVEPKKSTQIAESIITLFSDEELLKFLSSNARNSVKKFSWDYNMLRLFEASGYLLNLKK